ncbi:twin-arginine translocation signal domain-containing protein [Sphingomonas sp. JC676]|uniref:exo-rhamnogalacturonan lyase family protein n=1 Tax=Sphingomonas sp. JC676 TaxID=2768065 RepID=UPI0016579B0A|nr:twin-arginine translocation signal domain-containing protein [Sphingomonas sp. JC676]MBC9031873.1 twin-arginine translocation signal domain-containing protein [Sphingomonas sp. JC676]
MTEIPVSRRDFIKQAALAGAAVPMVTDAAVAATTQTQKPSPDADIAWLDGAPPATHEGQSWGMPWPRGTVPARAQFRAATSTGKSVPVQSWTTAWWPDGSIKWTAHAIPAGEALADGLRVAPGKSPAPAQPVRVTAGGDSIEVSTGAVTWRIGKSGDAILRSATNGGRESLRDVRLVATAQNGPDSDDGAHAAIERYTSDITSTTIEQNGPVRAVIRVEGTHKAGARGWLPFTLRLYFHAGSQAVRIVHSFIFDGDPDKDFIRGLGLSGAVPMRDQPHDRHVRFAGQDGGLWGEAVRPLTGLRRDSGKQFRDTQVAGIATPSAAELPKPVRETLQYIPAWGDFTLAQPNADGFAITKRTKPGHGWIDVDTAGRAPGLGLIGGPSGGVAFGMKDFWQRCPVRLDVRDAATDLAHFTIWHHAPDAAAMDLRMYHDGLGMNDHVAENQGLDITYEDYEKGWGTAHGIARTTEFTLWALPATPPRARLVEMAHEVSRQPRLTCAPARINAAGVFGDWSLVDRSTAARKAIEDQNDALLDYYVGQVDQRRWYGFWNYGDVMHSYDTDRHVWRYDIGGYAWDNSELSTDLWLWYSYLRSGRADVFRMAEAMTRHTGEVDVYHIGPYRGFGTRHGVQHWSDSSKQPRVSNAAYRRIYYFLTADERCGDLMHALIDSDYTLQRVEIGRKVDERAPGSAPPGGNSAVKAAGALPDGQVFVQFGTTWGSLISAWLTEWERTRDTKWRDRIVTGMRSIATLKQGWFAGGAPFELKTGRFLGPGDKVSVSHLNGVFGVFEMHAELLELLDEAAYREVWLDYCAFYNASDAEFRAKTGQPGRGRGLRAAHSRFTAYAAVQRKDAALAKRAWGEFLGSDDGHDTAALGRVRRISGPDVLKPIDEMAGVSTNGTAQWGLAAVANLALIGDALESGR